MKESENQLIELLVNINAPLTVNEISKMLGVTDRTVRNYITKINQKFDGKLVSKEGFSYFINTEYYTKIKDESKAIESPKERREYILLNLLKHYKIDIFHMANTLFVSESTIEKDLVNLRKDLKKYNIELIKEKEYVYLESDVESRRMILNDLISSELSHRKILTLEVLQRLFTNIDIYRIYTILKDIFEEELFYVNGYIFNTLILHIAIMIEQQELRPSNIEINEVPDSQEYYIANKILTELAKENDYCFRDSDVISLGLLLVTKITPMNKQYLNKYVKSDKYKFVKKTLEEVMLDYFDFPLDKELILKLTIHISNALERAKTGMTISNPLILNIKKEHGLIYDIAVIIASRIFKEYYIQLSDDEICFLAIHIGSYFTQHMEKREFVKAILIVPKYYDTQANLTYLLSKEYEDKMIIMAVFETIEELELHYIGDYDLIITTLPELNTSIKSIQISPFISSSNLKRISLAIDEIGSENKEKSVIEIVNKFSNDKYFYKNLNLKTKEEYINFMSGELCKDSVIDASIINQIFERESLSSTSYDNGIAIPHPLHMEANQSMISIAINDNPIPWGDYFVRIVILIVIHPDEVFKFRELLDYIFNKLDNLELVLELSESQTYEDFIHLLLNRN